MQSANDAPKQESGDAKVTAGDNAKPSSTGPARRIALIGAGYIAAVHAEALKVTAGVDLVGVIDSRIDRATSLARRNGGPAVTSSLAEMLEAVPLDAVHVLTPPNLHTDLAREALSCGLSVLLEKPMASDIEGAEQLAEFARTPGVPPLYINHNFLFHPAFAQLAKMIEDGRCGTLINLSCTFAMPLRQLAMGQLQHWMFRRPVNLLLEQAVHPLSQILSLTGSITRSKVLAGTPYNVGSPSPIPRTLSIALSGEKCDAQVYLHFGSTYPVWKITALCSDGVIKANMVQNRLICEEQTKNLESLDNLIQINRLSRELRKQARSDFISYGRSILGLSPRSDTFYRSMVGSIGAFHRQERPWVNTPEGACSVVRLCEEIAAEAFPMPAIGSSASVQTVFRADAVVLGGTGFIGHHIVKEFSDKGMKVTAVSRAPVMRNDSKNVLFLHGDIRDGEKLAKLIRDVPFVVNAAGPEITEDWTECERKVQEAVTMVSYACKSAGVRRLVHLSSIAALYLGNKDEIVTGGTSVDPYGWQRSNYSRAKGAEEIALLTKYEEGMLPVSILRPAIVVGEGGMPYHTGVGLFTNERHCMGWNEGENPLPFILAEDVASAVLVAMNKEGMDGHCYNLAGDVRLSAKEYIAVLARALGRPLVFHPQSPNVMFFSELMKWGIKRVGGRKAALPSKRDLLSRGMSAMIDCADVKSALGWAPVSERSQFISRAITVHGQEPKDFRL